MAEKTDKWLSIDDILRSQDAKVERVDVPEWGGYVYLGPLGGDDRDWLDGKLAASKDKASDFVGVRREVVARSLRTEKGERMVISAAQVAALGGKNGEVIDRLFQHCQRISGLTGKDAVEAAVKN